MTKVASNDPPESEDCLFLDVVVPRGIFESDNDNGDSARGKIDTQYCLYLLLLIVVLAPVMVWLYGGGYVFGKS